MMPHLILLVPHQKSANNTWSIHYSVQLLDRYRDGKHCLSDVPAAPAKLALPWNDQVKHTSGTRAETTIDTMAVVITMQLQSLGIIDPVNVLYILDV